LEGGYAVVGQCEIGVLVDVVGAHDSMQEKEVVKRWRARVGESYTNNIGVYDLRGA